jgi:hypothetical protein
MQQIDQISWTDVVFLAFAAAMLTGLHFAATTLMTAVMKWLGCIQPSYLPLPELLKFDFFVNLSIVGMDVSLMWNSVGFYQVKTEVTRIIFIHLLYWNGMLIRKPSALLFQIARLCIIPVLYVLEIQFDKVLYSRDTKLIIVLVVVGVAVCTVFSVIRYMCVM